MDSGSSSFDMRRRGSGEKFLQSVVDSEQIKYTLKNNFQSSQLPVHFDLQEVKWKDSDNCMKCERKFRPFVIKKHHW